MNTKVASAAPRIAAMVLSGVAAVFPATAARADAKSTKTVCIEASERGQELRDEGKLLDAREKFLACAAQSCPPIIKTDCADWLSDVIARTPSVVIRARGPDGRDVTDVRVSMDGKPLTGSLDGKAVSIDPGQHAFRFERDGSPALQEAVLIREGEQRRMLEVSFQPDGSASSSPRRLGEKPGPEGRIPPVALAVAGVGLAGVAGFAVFGLIAKSDVNEMRETCAPGCAPSDVDAARTKMILANVSLGAGVLALGAATWLTLSSSSRGRPSSAVLLLSPVPGGGAAAVIGRF